MAWRVCVGALTAGAWALFAWFASHRSTSPDVLGRWSSSYAGVLAALLALALLATAVHLPRPFSWLRRTRRRLALTAVALLVVFVAVEWWARAFDPLGISQYTETRRYGEAMLRDDDLGFRHRPGLRDTFQCVDVAINELGLRDAPVAPRADDETRLLVLGDSVTFGWGVAEEHVFCRRLERLLRERITGPVRVLNAGVGGYNSEQEVRFLEREGARLDPQLVLLVYITNDVDARLAPPPAMTPPRAALRLLGHSALYRMAAHAVHHGGRPIDIPTRATPGWQGSMDAVERAASWCRERSIPFVVYLLRREDDDRWAALMEDLAAAAERGGGRFADTRAWFGDRTRLEISHSATDGHPNVEGHRLIAEGLLQDLAAHELAGRVE